MRIPAQGGSLAALATVVIANIGEEFQAPMFQHAVRFLLLSFVVVAFFFFFGSLQLRVAA